MSEFRCPHCRTSLPERAPFCSACGRRIEGWSSAPPEATPALGTGALPDGEVATRQVDVTPSLLRALALSRRRPPGAARRPGWLLALAMVAVAVAGGTIGFLAVHAHKRRLAQARAQAAAAAARESEPEADDELPFGPAAPTDEPAGALAGSGAPGAATAAKSEAPGAGTAAKSEAPGAGTSGPAAAKSGQSGAASAGPSPGGTSGAPAAARTGQPVVVASAPAAPAAASSKSSAPTAATAGKPNRPPQPAQRAAHRIAAAPVPVAAAPTPPPRRQKVAPGGLPHKAVSTDSQSISQQLKRQERAAAASPAAPPQLPAPVHEASADQPPAPAAEATEKATAEAALDADSIRLVVRQHLPQVRACYSRAFKDSSPGGTVEIGLAIDGSGRARNVRTETNSTDSPELARCLESRVREWQFPRSVSSTGDDYELIYPFVFAPGS